MTSLDSPARVSNTIPELASVSQITAPNCFDAELNVASLASQASQDCVLGMSDNGRSKLEERRGTTPLSSPVSQLDAASWPYQDESNTDLGSNVQEQGGNENADPNPSRGQSAAGVELQPAGKQRQPFGHHQVLLLDQLPASQVLYCAAICMQPNSFCMQYSSVLY